MNDVKGGNIELELRKFVSPEYVFGVDARLLVGNYCQQLGAKRVLLVTDSGILKTPWYNDVVEIFKNLRIDFYVYSSVSPNPRDFEVMQGAHFYGSNGCNIILALGGGSVMDCAKGIGIVSANGKSIEEFEGVDKIFRPMPPLICVPTTAGTAADLSQFAIINRISERYKMAIISKAAVPDVALIDPVVLTTMNPFLTACTGMDALSHAFEAYVSNASSSFTDLYALEAVRLINENLLNSIQNPSNIQLRGRIMLASLYAGLAFSNASLGCVHAMAHSLGGYLDLPHGECNAILLPHVVGFNYSAAKSKYSILAKTMNANFSGNTSVKHGSEFVDFLNEFRSNLGIGATLSQRGVSTDIISILSQKAIKDPCNATNPRLPKKRDLATIFQEAM
jgi:alcohol dehydrogenase